MDHMGSIDFTGFCAKIILKIRRLLVFERLPVIMYNSISIADTIIKKGRYQEYGYSEKVYNIMKSSMNKKEYVPTISQIARELNIAEHEANAAIGQLKESGRIKITDIPRKTTIEFTD